MNDILYYEPLADLFEADATYQDAPTQARFGYLTLAASFHWNLLKLLGNVSPTYHLAPPAADHDASLVQLPYLNDSLKLHVKLAGISSDDWLEHASAALLAEIHADCMASLLCTGSADVATTLLSNVGGTLVIRVVLNALRLAHQLRAELTRVCTGKNKALPKHLARHIATIALTLRDDRLGALLVVSSSEEMIQRLIRNRQEAVSPVEALYSRLFLGRPLCKLSTVGVQCGGT